MPGVSLGKIGRGLPHSTPLREVREGSEVRKGVECASPLALRRRTGGDLAAVPAESFAAVMGPLGTVPAIPEKMAYGAGLTR